MGATVFTGQTNCERQRLELRLSGEQLRTLERAAVESGQSVGAFVLDRAIEAAAEAAEVTEAGLASSGAWVSEERWSSFCAMLDHLQTGAAARG